MKGVVVTYTVRPDFVDTNKRNIKAVMEELRALGDRGVKYASFQRENGNTFVHVAMTRDEEAAKIIGGLASFKHFQQELKTGVEPGKGPSVQNLSAVDSSFAV